MSIFAVTVGPAAVGGVARPPTGREIAALAPVVPGSTPGASD
jgi:hypothetical protein